MADPFIGEIRAVGFTFAPYGWSVCNGSVLNVSQNNALFALFGSLYGGNGSSTFGLPDLRSRAIVGTGQGPGLSPYIQGQSGGSEVFSGSVTLTANNLPVHSHTSDPSKLTVSGAVTINCNDTAGTQPTGDQAFFGKAGTLNGKTVYDTNAYNKTAPNKTMDSGTATFAGSIGGTLPISGGGYPSPLPVVVAGDNRSPYQSLLYIVALSGVFPTRD